MELGINRAPEHLVQCFRSVCSNKSKNFTFYVEIKVVRPYIIPKNIKCLSKNYKNKCIEYKTTKTAIERLVLN